MDIALQTKLLKLKGFLNEINHISYTYSQIGKNTPFDTLTKESATQLIGVYQDLLQQTKVIVSAFEKDKNK